MASGYEKQGFHVIRKFQNGNMDDFILLWREEGIYKIIFAGHGSVIRTGKRKGGFAGLSVQGDKIPFHPGDADYVHPDHISVPYKLSDIVALTCGSSCDLYDESSVLLNGDHPKGKWTDHLSSRGHFFGFNRSVNWYNSNPSAVIK